MTYEVMQQCADLILADAVQDVASRTGRPASEVLQAAVVSDAYEILYDFETGLWAEGPDAFAALMEEGWGESLR